MYFFEWGVVFRFTTEVQTHSSRLGQCFRKPYPWRKSCFLRVHSRRPFFSSTDVLCRTDIHSVHGNVCCPQMLTTVSFEVAGSKRGDNVQTRRGSTTHTPATCFKKIKQSKLFASKLGCCTQRDFVLFYMNRATLKELMPWRELELL